MTQTLNKVKWLNIHALCSDLMQKEQTLNEVHYFTSRVSNSPDKERRQSLYIDALNTTPVIMHYGKYKSKNVKCMSCHHSWRGNEEKMTDVNIAVQMIVDGMNDKFDKAILISGDSDLIPPIRAIKENFPNKKVTVAFPPNRHNNSVKNEAHASLTIGRRTLQKNQFPNIVKTQSGFDLNKPPNW